MCVYLTNFRVYFNNLTDCGVVTIIINNTGIAFKYQYQLKVVRRRLSLSPKGSEILPRRGGITFVYQKIISVSSKLRILPGISPGFTGHLDATDEPARGPLGKHCFRSSWWATVDHGATWLRVTHIPKRGAWCERITVMAYPLPWIALCRGVTAIFAQPRFCALSVRVEWRRQSSSCGETPRKRAASGRLTGFIVRRWEKWGLLSYSVDGFSARLTEPNGDALIVSTRRDHATANVP